MKQKILRYGIIMSFAVLIALTVGCKSKDKNAGGIPSMKVMEITTTKVPVFLKMVGQAEGIPTIDIRARVSGYLKEFSFKEGMIIPKGQLLFMIEQDQYRNNLDYANADLDSKTAAWEKAQLDVERLKPLLATNAISQNDYDKAVTTEKQDRAAVASSKAQLEQAKLNLSYTTMFAPITGYIGKANVRPGNLVGVGEATLLATISALDPIYINFRMSETDYLKIAHVVIQMKDQMEKPVQQAQQAFNIYLALSDNSSYPLPGKIDFVDRNIDKSTGTIALRAVFPNPDGLIKPGTFANVYLVLTEKQEGIVIPQKAITQIQGKNFVYLVDKNNKVSRSPVVPGRNIGQRAIINQGLAAGDRIMLEGFQKFQEGMQITPVLVKDTFSFPENPVAVGK